MNELTKEVDSLNDFLTGEVLLKKADKVSLSVSQFSVLGSLWITNYRLIFKASNSQSIPYSGYHYITIYLLSIFHAKVSLKKNQTFTIHAKPFKKYKFRSKDPHTLLKILLNNTLPKIEKKDLFCFYNKEGGSTPSIWYNYPPLDDKGGDEFNRMGISTKAYIRSSYTENVSKKKGFLRRFHFYPEKAWYPNTWTDAITKDVASHREGERCLLVTYAKEETLLLTGWRTTYAGTIRQEPLDSLAFRKKNPRMPDGVRMVTWDVGHKKIFYTENWLDFRFLNLPNQNQLVRQFTEIENYLSNPEPEYKLAYDTGWATTITQVLNAANQVAVKFSEGITVTVQGYTKNLNHTVVASLAQVILDPYYRTARGLCALIEKDWVGVSYDFLADCGISDEESYKDSQQPYFTLFLNSLVVLLNSSPYGTFEYGVSLPELVLEHSCSGRFGTFLYYDPVLQSAAKKTPSLWDYVLRVPDVWRNGFYREASEGMLTPKIPNSKGVWDYFVKGQSYQERLVAQTLWSKPPLPSIPESSQENPVMTAVDLEGSALVSPFPWFLAGIPNLTSLNLARNRIPEITDAFWMLTELKILDLSYNPLGSIASSLWTSLKQSLPKLNTLRLNGLSSLQFPSYTGPLTMLTLNGIGYLTFPEEIEMVNLDILEIKSVRLTKFPPIFRQFMSLTQLDLTDNEMEHLSEVSYLTNLHSLVLKRNKFSTFPDELVKLMDMYALDMSHNSLSTLSVELAKLTNLKYLDFGFNKIAAESSNLSKFFPTSLVSLDLSHNDILTFPSGFPAYEHLQYLDLSYNCLSCLPLDFLLLSSLSTLNLSNNLLTALPLQVGATMKNLTHLDISHNRLTVLPPSLGTLPLNKFYWQGNLELENFIPVEIMQSTADKQGPEGLLGYLKDLAGGERPLYRIKIMMVGQENVGKTTVVRALAKGWDKMEHGSTQITGATVSTDGIDITKCTFLWDNTYPKTQVANLPSEKIPIEVTFWDFAGQEVYYTTHQFFLSERSIYVIVWNLVVPIKHSQVGYWLNSLTSKIKRPVVIILGTHYDTLIEKEKEVLDQTLETNIQEILSQFPTLKLAIIPSSLKDMYGFQEFRAKLEKVIVSQKHMGEKLPRSHLLLEQLVEEERTKHKPPILLREEWFQICNTCSILQDEVILRATQLLHNFGTLVHYEEDPQLRQWIILDPQWLSDIMATLITTKHKFAASGILRHALLPQIWKKYPENIYPHLLKLLKKFEIAYELPTSISNSQGVPSVLTTGDWSRSRRINGSTRPPALALAASRTEYRRSAPVQSPRNNGRYGGVLPLGEGSSQRRRGESTKKERSREGISTKSEESLTEPPLSENFKMISENKGETPLPEKIQPISSEKNTPEKWNPQGVSLIPCLLITETPSDLIHHWQTYPPPNTQERNRYIEFIRFVPKGFTARLMVRILNLYPPVDFQNTIYWADGLFLGNDSVCIMVRMYPKNRLLGLFVRGKRRETVVRIFCNLMAAVNLLVVEWVNLERKQSVRCLGCLRKHCKTFHHFTEDDLQNIAMRGESYIDCPLCQEHLFLEELVPDLTMVYFNGSKVKEEELTFERIVGQGGFASVWKGRWGNKDVAIKKLDQTYKEDNEDRLAKAYGEFRKEIFVMSKINSDYCIKLHAICMDPLCLITEYLGCGDLHEYLYKKTSLPLTWNFRLKIIHDIAAGLSCMHTANPPIMHLDLKSPNVLLVTFDETAPVVAKVIDFGCASTSTTQYIRHVDNPTWLAPEILQGTPYESSVDIYSLGVIMYETLTRKIYFGDSGFSQDIVENVLEGRRPPLDASTCWPEWALLMNDCWNQKPVERPKAEVVVKRICEMKFKFLVILVGGYMDVVVGKMCFYWEFLWKL